MANQKSGIVKTIITILISLAFAALFMSLALRGLDFEKIKQSMLRANYLWLFIAMVFGLLAYWFRAVRWNILLEPLSYRVKNSNSLWAISFGYLMNLTIPRSGEIARSTALYNVENVPVDKSFGTIILERVVDLCCMLFFLLLTLIFKYDAIIAFYHSAIAQQEKGKKTQPSFLDESLIKIGITNTATFWFYFKIVLSVVIFGAILYIFLYKKDKLLSFLKGILEGLTSIFKLKQKGKFLLYTALIWICYYFAAYLVCFALPETSNFTIADGFFIIVVGTLGMMVPASGGIGAFHFALKLGISALFVSMGKNGEIGAQVGLSYAFLSHTLQIVIMLVMGLLAIPMLAKEKSKN